MSTALRALLAFFFFSCRDNKFYILRCPINLKKAPSPPSLQPAAFRPGPGCPPSANAEVWKRHCPPPRSPRCSQLSPSNSPPPLGVGDQRPKPRPPARRSKTTPRASFSLFFCHSTGGIRNVTLRCGVFVGVGYSNFQLPMWPFAALTTKECPCLSWFMASRLPLCRHRYRRRGRSCVRPTGAA